MATNIQIEQVKVEGNRLIEHIKQLIHEGNVRRIIITQSDGDVVAEFPLTVGLIGTMLAPVVAAIGAIIALLAECRIYIERTAAANTIDPLKEEQAAQLVPGD